MLTCATSVGYIMAPAGFLSLREVPNYCQLK